MGTRIAKVIHLNEFKIHIVLGQIIQCQAQTVCIYVCWQSRPLSGRHSFILVSCAQLGSHHSLPKPMHFLVFGSRRADKKQSQFHNPTREQGLRGLEFLMKLKSRTESVPLPTSWNFLKVDLRRGQGVGTRSSIVLWARLC